MEIIRVANGDYDRYEELLLQRDQLEKEAFGYSLEYTRQFGDLIVEAFQLKVECISLKKSVAFCLTAKNRGEKADPSELSFYLQQQMAAYYAELDSLISQRDASRKGKPISAYQVQEIKKLYRKIAKLLHPDISPLTSKYPELSDLFQRVMIAYQCNDLKEMEELEVLINKVLENNGIDKFNIVISDVTQKISDLENEIEHILTTEPYLYKNLFPDSEKMAKKKEELDKEIEDYRTYKAELEKYFAELTDGGE